MTAGVAVGTASARAVRGWSAGADVAVAGATPLPTPTAEALTALRVRQPPVCADGLAGLAELARARDDVPLVVLAADLDLTLPALLDLLDRPGVGTAATVVEPAQLDRGLARLDPVRVGADGVLVESVGAAGRAVTAPNRALLGALRVAPADRGRAAELWSAAVGSGDGQGWPDVGLAVLVLVRGGLAVHASPLGPFAFERGPVAARGAPPGRDQGWRQRLRGASRGGDGFYSTYAVRPLSRRLTGLGLRLGWAPNAVTVASLALGLAATALVWTGNRWLWAVGAVVLQLALVVDCVDGELARFTRRFSAFGAWLDATGDRVKEYALVAALGSVAVREGDPNGWLLAGAALVVTATRHLEDSTYGDLVARRRRSRPALLPLSRRDDGGPAGARTGYPPPPSRRAAAVFWAKKVIHLPIAERYLLLSLTLLTGSPQLVLWTLVVAVVVAVAWTQGGRSVAALRERAAGGPGSDDRGPGWVERQLDLGPLGLLTRGRRVRHPLGWQLPALLWLVEGTVVLAVAHTLPVAARAVGFALLCAVAYHRYDVMYRLRDTGQGPPGWLTLAGLGVDGRVAVVLAAGLLLGGSVGSALWWLTAYLSVLFLAESVVAWRVWLRAHPVRRPGAVTA